MKMGEWEWSMVRAHVSTCHLDVCWSVGWSFLLSIHLLTLWFLGRFTPKSEHYCITVPTGQYATDADLYSRVIRPCYTQKHDPNSTVYGFTYKQAPVEFQGGCREGVQEDGR